MIVRAVLGLGRSLEIPCVAEGVETQEQIDFLRGENCAELQGYAIGRPSPVDSISAWTLASATSAYKTEAAPAPKKPRRRKAA